MPLNKSLKSARSNKNDEFYTQLSDIERELKHYRNHFKEKVVYCNADDPRVSNFFKYFYLNFEHLGLKKIIATCYKNQDIDLFSMNDREEAVWLEYNGNGNIGDFDKVEVNNLKGDGDFRSGECIKLLKQADIVVTNPPFSLFREYISQLVEYDKKFIIIGNQNAITYKEIFPLIAQNKLWLGYHSGDMEFQVPDYYEPRKTRFRIEENGVKWRSMGNICWFTNLDIEKRHENIILYKPYNEEEYPKYDNYDAINVNKVADIPVDYDGVMGVPTTFLAKYNPSQFKLLGIMNTGEENKGIRYENTLHGRPVVNGAEIYIRILIERRRKK